MCLNADYKTLMTDKYVIRLANQNDLEGIMNFHNHHLFENINGNISSGFIRIKYDGFHLTKIIDEQEMVIALSGSMIIGYYLIGKKADNDKLKYQILKAKELVRKNESVAYKNIGYGCQVCINEGYRNQGVFDLMLNKLRGLVGEKYNYLLCSVSDTNVISLKRHLKSGWIIADYAEPNNYLIYNMTSL